MKIDPYKFALVTTLAGRYSWAGKAKPRTVPGARYVRYTFRQTCTYRLDLDQAFFAPKPDRRRRHSIRERLTALFTKLNNNFFANATGKTLVLMWTDASHWLGDRQAIEAMESWDGSSKEPDMVWEAVKVIGPWED